MSEKEVISLLYTIYTAGYEHGFNENSVIPDHSTFDAFNRLIIGENPTNDGRFYDIKDKIEKLTKSGILK